MTSSATIDCPRCRAHYHISSELLAQGEQSFHCGTCDHLFSAQPKFAEQSLQELSESPSLAPSSPGHTSGISLEQLTAQLEADMPADQQELQDRELSEELQESAAEQDSWLLESQQDKIQEPLADSSDSDGSVSNGSDFDSSDSDSGALTVDDSDRAEPQSEQNAGIQVSLEEDEIQNLINGISAEALEKQQDEEAACVTEDYQTEAHEQTVQEEPSEFVAEKELFSTEDSDSDVFVQSNIEAIAGAEAVFENVIEELAAEQAEADSAMEQNSDQQETHAEQNFDDFSRDQSSQRSFGEPKVTLAETDDSPTTELSAEERQQLVSSMSVISENESRIEQLDLGLEATLERLPLEDETHEIELDLKQEQETLRQAGLNKLERERVELELERKTQSRIPIDLNKEETEGFTDLLSSPAALLPEESRSFSLGFLCLPVFLFLCLLGAAGYFLSLKENTLAVQIARALSQSAPRVPPAGLRIRNTKFEQVRLSSGDVVPVIRGTIYNDTTSTYQAIQIEGILFDSAGKPQRQLRANAGVLPPDIENYTLDMISAQQAQASDKRFELSPGSSQRFVIALPGSERQTPGFYTARIYSAKS